MLRLISCYMVIIVYIVAYDINKLIDKSQVTPCKAPESSAKLCYKTNNFPITNTIKTYNSYGNFYTYTPYLNGLINGFVKVYESNNILESETFYTNSRRTGMTKVYYRNGQIRFKINYLQGNKEGIEEEYHQSGYLLAKTLYRNGQKNGIMIYYYPNGIIYNEVPYSNDAKEGVANYYLENGEIYAQIYYRRGKRDGQAVFYYTKADTKARSFLDDDELPVESNAQETSYYVSGRIGKAAYGKKFMVLNYKQDKIISGIKYDPLGQSTQMTKADMVQLNDKTPF